MKKVLSVLLILMMLFPAVSVLSLDTVYADQGTKTVDTQSPEEFTLPDIVPEEEAVERGYIGRVKEEEKDNYTFVFKDSENMRTMRVYSHPVKYTDKDGNTKDITLDIQFRPGGGFETKDNSIKTTFGAKLSDGIRLQSEDVDIKLIPANSLNQATLSEDSKTVSYTLDEKTTLEYSLTYTGFKEDIVVNEYTGQTEYEFLLYTNGLTVKEEMGSYYLADVQGNRKANIGDIIIFTADERNNTLGELSCIEIKENQIYGLTIHVDAEYLKDEKTVYPIRIDPTLEVTDSANAPIEDVTVYTGPSYFSGTLGILYLGTADNYKYRIMMRFPNLEFPVVFPEMFIDASVELRDVMCQGVHVDVECRYYSGSATAWSESTTTTWNSVNPDYCGELLDTQTIFYGNGNVPGMSQRYSFDITEAVKAWAAGTHSPQRGLVFKAKDESFSSTEDRLKYFGSYNRSDYKPSFTVRYRTEEIYTFSVYRNSTEKFMYALGSGSSNVSFENSSQIESLAKSEYNNITGNFLANGSATPYNFGKSMWCVKYNTYYDAYQIISMGTRLGNGQRQACVYSTSTDVGLGDDFMLTTSTLFTVEPNGNSQYVFKSYTTGKYLCVNSGNKLTQTNNSSEATTFTLTNIPAESLNNFWSGSYNSGIYDGVAHIKIVLDNSVKQSALYGNNDFSSTKLWNGITDNIIIYGPNDAPPAGITPFYVTFKVLPALENATGAMVPNGLDYTYFKNLSDSSRNEILSSNWNSVTIYLDSRSSAYEASGAYLNTYINKTITHEMGHALKLTHPDQTDCLHEFQGSNGGFCSYFCVYSVMNVANPNDSTSSKSPLTAATPQMIDKINLQNKWEIHNCCTH
ncbi:MAG: DNRLRE domain-containing protein [Clostridia bacterium]|nr:DNRLRE domain-containing protein [Clostridia bacterium]